MPRRIVIIYNPKSSHAADVRREVLLPLQLLFAASPKSLVAHAISSPIFEENVQQISQILHPHDIVISAGGDGTAAIASNSVLATKHPNISIGYLGYGNFDDYAGVFTGRSKTIHDLIARSSHTIDAHPVAISINSKHFRHAVLYSTVGITATSCDQFEDKSRRKKLSKSRHHRIFYSLAVMIRFYFRVRRTSRLAPFTLDDQPARPATDFFIINTPRAARILRYRGELFRDPKKFLVAPYDFSRVHILAAFMIKSFFGRMPGRLTGSTTITFDNPATIDIQCEGEHRHLQNVHTLTVTKAAQHLNVIKLK